MDKVAISVRNVSKVFKLYHRRSKRLLDFFSLGLGRWHHDEEFCALDNVSFEILQGTAVGIIGRNGAGKSTLLRILAGNSTPTNGEVKIEGKVSALLELGTGFHPELTGRQNIYAGGVYLGLTQDEIDRLYTDIVEFSELEDFIHQPVKTYSYGMYMRLAFAVSTAIHPDILLIDEVLGVGDAYFFRKCVDRIRSFLEKGKTVLIVSHDLGTLQRLCSRLLWIDRGRLVMDGAPLDVLKAYEISIREQEALRLKSKNTPLVRTVRSARGVVYGYGTGEIVVEEVKFLNRLGAEQLIFSVAESFTIRIRYTAKIPVAEPVFAVSLYRVDGVTVAQFISSRDGMHLGTLDGEGVLDLLIDQPMLGSGHYVITVAILPYVDLLDKVGATPYDLHDRAYEFKIEPLIDCAIDLGVAMQPVRWCHTADPVGVPQSVKDTGGTD